MCRRSRHSLPATYGYDPTYRTPMSEYSPARARALLDTYGYVDRDGDGWRETPQGEPLTLEIASTNTQRDRSVNELWTKFMNRLGLRTDFRIAQWPELVKQSMAGQLMIWGYAWQLGQPDSDRIFGMAYGPNTESINDARFNLPAYNRLFRAAACAAGRPGAARGAARGRTPDGGLHAVPAAHAPNQRRPVPALGHRLSPASVHVAPLALDRRRHGTALARES